MGTLSFDVWCHFVMAQTADLAQILHKAVADLVLHCLLVGITMKDKMNKHTKHLFLAPPILMGCSVPF